MYRSEPLFAIGSKTMGERSLGLPTVCQLLRHISSALIVLKNFSTATLS